MMQGLLEYRYEDRDCLYYMALSHYHLDDLVASRRCLERLLTGAPNCRQEISLLDIVKGRLTKAGVIGISSSPVPTVLASMLAAVELGCSRRGASQHAAGCVICVAVVLVKALTRWGF